MADDFRTTEVGDRYAQALFDLALETGRLDAVRADVVSLKTAWIESADLRRLATSPVISADDQVKGLTAVAAKARFEPNTHMPLRRMRSFKPRDLRRTARWPASASFRSPFAL